MQKLIEIIQLIKIKILLPIQEQKIPKYLVKRKEEPKTNRVRCKYTNYFSLFSCYKSDKKNTDNKDKDLIEILKEIKQKENAAILVKEERKKTRIINREK